MRWRGGGGWGGNHALQEIRKDRIEDKAIEPWPLEKKSPWDRIGGRVESER